MKSCLFLPQVRIRSFVWPHCLCHMLSKFLIHLPRKEPFANPPLLASVTGLDVEVKPGLIPFALLALHPGIEEDCVQAFAWAQIRWRVLGSRQFEATLQWLRDNPLSHLHLMFMIVSCYSSMLNAAVVWASFSKKTWKTTQCSQIEIEIYMERSDSLESQLISDEGLKFPKIHSK